MNTLLGIAGAGFGLLVVFLLYVAGAAAVLKVADTLFVRKSPRN